MDKTAILVGVVLLMAALVCAQVDYTSKPFLIPPQAIVPITPMQFSSGLGLITPQVHAATIRDAASKTPIFAQSIVGVVPAYGLLGTVKPLNIPLVWWAIGILLLIVSFISARSLRGRAIQELPIANAINKTYVYIIAAFIMIILWLGVGAQYQFAMFYLGANLAALVILDKVAERFDWYRDFKLGIAMDSSVFGFQVDSAVRLMMMGAGTFLMMLYMASGNAYIATPMYSAETTTLSKITAVIPVIPEDLLWFRLIPVMLLVLFMKAAFWLINAFGDGQKRSLFENRNNTPKLYLSIFLTGAILVAAFNGTVVWSAYHDHAYGQTSLILAQQTGRPADEIKEELLSSVANFGTAGSFISLVSGSVLPCDAVHWINNWGSR